MDFHDFPMILGNLGVETEGRGAEGNPRDVREGQGSTCRVWRVRSLGCSSSTARIPETCNGKTLDLA